MDHNSAIQRNELLLHIMTKNEPQKCYAKKPDTQDYVLHDSIYMKSPEKENP